ALLDVGDGGEGRVFVGEIDLDVVLGAHRPRAVFREGVARAGDDAPSGGGEALDGGMADAAARSGEQQGAAGLVGGGGCVRHGADLVGLFADRLGEPARLIL